MKDDFVMPIVVLTLICLVVSGAIAATNSVTEPVITSAAEARAEAARFEMIPEATGFRKIDLDIDGLPYSVKEAYSSENDVGYVFILVVRGYGGDMTLICGIDANGTMLSSATLSHSETRGLGSKITETPFVSKFRGADRRLDEVSAITGATLSTVAYIDAMGDAFTAFEIVRGMS